MYTHFKKKSSWVPLQTYWINITMGGLGMVFLRNNFTDEHRSIDTARHPSYGWGTMWARIPMFDVCIMPLVTACPAPKLIHLTSFSCVLNFYTEFKISHPLPTKQEKTLHMDITRWLTPKSDWLYSLQPKMQKLYIVSKNKTRSWLWFSSWTPYCQIQTEIEESRENH